MTNTTTETTGAALAGEEGVAPVKTSIELTAEQFVWRQAYLDAAAMEKQWAETKEIARKHLEAALGDAEEGKVGNDVVVRYSWVKSSRLDQKKLKEQAPELVESCMVTSVSRRFTVPTGDDQ
jgi:predicted phage-related endonuclease